MQFCHLPNKVKFCDDITGEAGIKFWVQYGRKYEKVNTVSMLDLGV